VSMFGDPRVTPIRDGAVASGGVLMQVSAGVGCIRRTPEPDGRLETQALFGETFTVFHEEAGFGWGQQTVDGYVGWMDMEALSQPVVPTSHVVCALRTYLFSAPDIKSAPRFLLSMNAAVCEIASVDRFVEIARGGFVVREHLSKLGHHAGDWVAEAERFLDAPYQWGGRESLGLDCSGLVQTAMLRAGRWAPRDSDMQEAALGTPVPITPDLGGLKRGDLIFWRGHVGVMIDSVRLLHANGHHMATRIEPLATAATRIEATPSGPITSIRRLAQ
jgi:hypothetical protein